MEKEAAWEPKDQCNLLAVGFLCTRAGRSKWSELPDGERTGSSTVLNPTEDPGAHGRASSCDIYFQSGAAWIYPNMRHRKCSELKMQSLKSALSLKSKVIPVEIFFIPCPATLTHGPAERGPCIPLWNSFKNSKIKRFSKIIDSQPIPDLYFVCLQHELCKHFFQLK